MSTNKQLGELYESKWPALKSAAAYGPSMAYPLLIKVDEPLFESSDVRIMILGQETDGWCGQFPRQDEDLDAARELTVDELMGEYRKYFYTSDDKRRRPFWNKCNFKYFEDNLTPYFNSQGQKTAFVWNNLSKIGNTGRGKATEAIRRIELAHFDVIEMEVQLLTPNIIIFATGHSRDGYIERAFGGDCVEFEYPRLSFGSESSGYPIGNIMARVRLRRYPDICALRVEHPNRRTLDNAVIAGVIKDIWAARH